MAEYFTNFSFVVGFDSEEQQDYALNLFRQMRDIHQGRYIPLDFPAKLIEVCEDCSFDAEAHESNSVWLHSNYGGMDAACAFVQHLLDRFQPDKFITFEWAHDCTKPRTDAYGGGAAYITAKKIKTFSTKEWLRARTKR